MIKLEFHHMMRYVKPKLLVICIDDINLIKN